MTLIRAAYRTPHGWTSEAHLVEGERIDPSGVRELIAGTMLVVEDPVELLACCALQDAGGGITRLGTFAVDPRRQGQGIGRWLLEQAAARAAGTLEVLVMVQQPALRAWYQRLGFTDTGTRYPFPADRRLARPLQDGLQFAVLRRPASIAKSVRLRSRPPV